MGMVDYELVISAYSRAFHIIHYQFQTPIWRSPLGHITNLCLRLLSHDVPGVSEFREHGHARGLFACSLTRLYLAFDTSKLSAMRFTPLQR